MRMLLLDRLGRLGEAYILDDWNPQLTDEYGCPILDLETHPLFPQPRRPLPRDCPDVRFMLDPFMVRPAPPLMTGWMDLAPESEGYKRSFKVFQDAIMCLTGRLVVALTK